jgi:CO/xanthine dehydrogenase Mo-binding subunit
MADQPWMSKVPEASKSIKDNMKRQDAHDRVSGNAVYTRDISFPGMQCLLNESHLGYGMYGSNGIGENIGASMAAITSSAVYNAIGKWILDYPITPDKVLKSLGKI